MYEATQMLNIGMVVFFVAIFVSVVLLILIQRNKIIPKQETRIMAWENPFRDTVRI